MSNEKIIEITRVGMDSKGQVLFRAIYDNQVFLYTSKSRKQVINAIIKRAHFNELLTVMADKNSSEEAPIFCDKLDKQLKHKDLKHLNLRMNGDPLDKGAEKAASDQQSKILDAAKTTLKKLSTFPWSFISGTGNIAKYNKNKKLVKKIKQVEHRLRNIQTFGASLFVIGIVLLLTFGSLMAFGWPIIVGGALALGGAALLGAASTCGLQSKLFQSMKNINRLSDEFLDPTITTRPTRRKPSKHHKPESTPHLKSEAPSAAKSPTPKTDVPESSDKPRTPKPTSTSSST